MKKLDSIKLVNIHNAVCLINNIDDINSIFERKRHKNIVENRQKFFYLALELTKLHEGEIGHYLYDKTGNYWDRNSVNHAHRKIEGFIEFDRSFANEMDLLKKLLIPSKRSEIIKLVIETENETDLLDKLQTYLKTA